MTSAPPSAPTAIVCEDEPLTSAALAEHCAALGYKVVARPKDGRDAVEAALSTQPDLVLMDIKMPGIDGIEASRQILTRITTTVLVITGHVTDEFVEGAAEAGVAGYLVKPVSLDQLRGAIVVATRGVERLRQALREVDSARQDLANRKLIERAKGCLMEDEGLTEREAYRRLQKRSQDERRPMVDLASEVLSSHERTDGEAASQLDPGAR